jgi:hypothetical protein
MTTRLEAWRLRGLRRNGTGRPSGRDVPGPAASRGTDTPGSVFEGSAMAPMRREPSLSRRKPRAAATGAPAGSLFLARRERHFLLRVSTPRCALAARATDAREVFLARARTTSEGRSGERRECREPLSPSVGKATDQPLAARGTPRLSASRPTSNPQLYRCSRLRLSRLGGRYVPPGSAWGISHPVWAGSSSGRAPRS